MPSLLMIMALVQYAYVRPDGAFDPDNSNASIDIHVYARGDSSNGEGHTGITASLYNPNSGEHFYTASEAEKNSLIPLGWRYEGVGWRAPTTGDPVYRPYNPNTGDHHCTMNASEYNWLAGLGWRKEGVGWRSAPKSGKPLYRQFNPNEVIGTHNYTASKPENDTLVRAGWRAEGVGWYGVQVGQTYLMHLSHPRL